MAKALTTPAPYYSHGGIGLGVQHMGTPSWQIDAMTRMGVPGEWAQNAESIESWLQGQQAQAQTSLLSAQSQAIQRQQADKIAQMQEQYKLQQQGQEAMWGRIGPMLDQFGFGRGGGGDGGTSGVSTAISSQEMNPIRTQASQQRRQVYAGGGSKQYRQTQLGAVGGNELSAMAQAISGGRAAGAAQQTNIFDALMRLFGQQSAASY